MDEKSDYTVWVSLLIVFVTFIILINCLPSTVKNTYEWNPIKMRLSKPGSRNYFDKTVTEYTF